MTKKKIFQFIDIIAEQHEQADKFINYAEVSRTLTGSRSVVTKNRMPKKHIKAVNELRHYISVWKEKYQK